ncbi:MAG: hypothetical protein WCY05_01905 [Candidatus Omnitrophota bacterium]
MSIKERMYQRVTYKQMLSCVRFCQNFLNLRDWTITLQESDTLEDLGNIEVDPNKMVATITINPQSHKAENENIYSTLIHECIHILSIGVCKIDANQSEPISYAFEDILYLNYVQIKKLKTANLKD